jgi:hypothetical protein
MRLPFSLSYKSLQIIRNKVSPGTPLITAIPRGCLQYYGTNGPNIIQRCNRKGCGVGLLVCHRWRENGNALSEKRAKVKLTEKESS